jgi:hypothetical protein
MPNETDQYPDHNHDSLDYVRMEIREVSPAAAPLPALVSQRRRLNARRGAYHATAVLADRRTQHYRSISSLEQEEAPATVDFASTAPPPPSPFEETAAPPVPTARVEVIIIDEEQPSS